MNNHESFGSFAQYPNQCGEGLDGHSKLSEESPQVIQSQNKKSRTDDTEKSNTFQSRASNKKDLTKNKTDLISKKTKDLIKSLTEISKLFENRNISYTLSQFSHEKASTKV